MLSTLRSSLVIVALSAAVPLVVSGEIQAGQRSCCCKACRQPCGRCNCPQAAPAAAPQTSYQPVVETQYAQQPVLQQRDVLATEYRTEPVIETVPATVVENVTVDEGSYQTVWVPRLTTKAVARTTYQARTAYRTVPYQVTRRVSEYATQTVPYQTVRYVPTTGSSLAYSAAPGSGIAGLPNYYSGSPAIAGTYPTIAAAPAYPTPVYPTLAYPTPVVASAPTASSAGQVPDARYADSPVTPITPRNSAGADRLSDSRASDRSRSLFVPAPSAAQVWRTQGGTLTR
jgi:hypothetical protein